MAIFNQFHKNGTIKMYIPVHPSETHLDFQLYPVNQKEKAYTFYETSQTGHNGGFHCKVAKIQ